MLRASAARRCSGTSGSAGCGTSCRRSAVARTPNSAARGRRARRCGTARSADMTFSWPRLKWPRSVLSPRRPVGAEDIRDLQAWHERALRRSGTAPADLRLCARSRWPPGYRARWSPTFCVQAALGWCGCSLPVRADAWRRRDAANACVTRLSMCAACAASCTARFSCRVLMESIGSRPGNR